MGSNIAENHPIAFRFALEAKQRGATLIHADPRFTRTSALCDIYAPIRPGSDIAFLGGIIRYVLESERWHSDPFFKEYTLNYTNIATIIDEDFKDPIDLGGRFSGWQEDKHAYDISSWQYQGLEVPSPLAEHYTHSGEPLSEREERIGKGPPPTDLTLTHPRCVYQILKRHYAAYTPEMVERVTGCPQETFIKIVETLLQ